MKKIYAAFTMLLLCVLAVSAANIKSSYTGTLNLNVNGKATNSQQTVMAKDNGNGTVSIVIPQFQYAVYNGPATIVADVASDGTLSNPKVTFSVITISSMEMKDSSITSTSCEVHLSMKAMNDAITVDFSGR